ncbi:MAG: D-Ala-D-Ala carboxypeptidase family metallohydrolase [candidate division Zixibacteria bacterium]|nr:D-Ala-D-Ala carboxypeptidase family metallohydrolase [candidate division Zixibacteria bacterium]
MDLSLVAFIDRLAVRLGEVPQFISTWRSSEKNAQVGGKPTSFHLSGKAADLLFRKTPLGKVYEEARLLDKAEGGSIGGIGLYLTPQPDGHTIGTIHLDTGPRHPAGRPRLWGRPEDGSYTGVNVVLAKLAPGGTVVGAILLFFC